MQPLFHWSCNVPGFRTYDQAHLPPSWRTPMRSLVTLVLRCVTLRESPPCGSTNFPPSGRHNCGHLSPSLSSNRPSGHRRRLHTLNNKAGWVGVERDQSRPPSREARQPALLFRLSLSLPPVARSPSSTSLVVPRLGVSCRRLLSSFVSLRVPPVLSLRPLSVRLSSLPSAVFRVFVASALAFLAFPSPSSAFLL